MAFGSLTSSEKVNKIQYIVVDKELNVLMGTCS